MLATTTHANRPLGARAATADRFARAAPVCRSVCIPTRCPTQQRPKPVEPIHVQPAAAMPSTAISCSSRHVHVSLPTTTPPGRYSPTGVPPAITAKLSDALKKALDAPDFKDQIAKVGGELFLGGNAEAVSFIQLQFDRMGKIIREGNIRPE